MAKKKAKARKAVRRKSENEGIWTRILHVEKYTATVILAGASNVYDTGRPYSSTTCCTCLKSSSADLLPPGGYGKVIPRGK